MQNPASADPAQVAAGGAEHQALLDDLQGLSGDESFHTAASQQAAETADADSNEHAAASSGAMLPRLTRLDTHQAQLAAPDSAMRSHSATANAHSAAAVGQSAPVPVNEQQGADAAQAADPHAAGLLHLPLDVLHLVLLRLQPRDWCALAAASKQLRPLAQANELWALCDPTYVRQQEAAARRQEAAVARRRGSRALSLLPVPMTSIRAAARGRKRRLSTSKGTLDGGDAVSDAAGGGFGVDATGASSEAEGIRIRQRRKRQLDQRKADGAGSDTDGEWLAPLSGGGSSADFGRAAAGGGGGSFIGGSGGGQLQDGPAGTSAAAGWPQHPPAHLILLPMLEQAAPTAAAVPHAQALAPAAAVVPAAAAITPLAGIRALQQPGGGVRLFYQRDGPRGQHQALRAALSAAATAAPWLPRRLAQQFLYGGRPQRGAAAGAEAGPAGSGTSSTHAHSPADGAEDVFKAAQGLQLQLAKSQAVSGQIGRRFDSMWQTHDQLRIALCDLWAEGELTECSDLRRSITKLTRISWALTYEAVAGGVTAPPPPQAV